MKRSPLFFARFIFGLAILAAVLNCGCKNQSSRQSEVSVPDGPDGKAILDKLIQRYATATRYRDDARLVLRYQLNGRPMEEHQLWSTSFERPGKINARLFNVRLRSDSNRLMGFVFDYETQNMDNQHLVLPIDQALPIDTVLNDSILRHFISGTSELPISPNKKSLVTLPTTIALLTGKNVPPWLERPEVVRRMDDVTFRDAQGELISCRRIQTIFDDMSFEFWIDPQDDRLVRIVFPNQILDPMLQTANEVTHLTFYADFGSGQFPNTIPSDLFSTELPDGANPVTKFIALPDRFPSKAIGRKPDRAVLLTTAGKIHDLLNDSKGTHQVIAWVDDQPYCTRFARRFSEFAKSQRNLDCRIAFVDHREETGNGNRDIMRQNAKAFAERPGIDIPVLCDSQRALGRLLEVKRMPTLVVIDDKGTIQYFLSVESDEWQERLAAVVRRIQAGDQVAAEMREEYDRFLVNYRQRLAAANPFASTLEKRNANPIHPVVDSKSGKIRSAKLEFESRWQSDQLSSPGNVYARRGDDKILVGNGWQSVAAFSLDGNLTDDRRILPEGDATFTRFLQSHDLPRKRIVFAAMGSQLYRFNQNWSERRAFPATPSEYRILEVQAADIDNDQRDDWFVLSRTDQSESSETPTTLKQLDLDTLQTVSSEPMTGVGFSILPGPAIGLKTQDARFVVTQKDGSIDVYSGNLQQRQSFEFDDHKVLKVFSRSRFQWKNSTIYAVGITVGSDQRWHAIGLDQGLNVVWSEKIGSQEFDTQIQPVAFGTIDGFGRVCGVCDHDQNISLFSEKGEWIDQIVWPHPIRGIGFCSDASGRSLLVVSDEKGVGCWGVSKRGIPAKVVSDSVPSKK